MTPEGLVKVPDLQVLGWPDQNSTQARTCGRTRTDITQPLIQCCKWRARLDRDLNSLSFCRAAFMPF